MLEPVAFNLFGFGVKWYGIVYSISFLLGYFFVTHFAKDFGFKSEFIEDIFFYVMIFSVICGRVFYIIFYNLNFYFNNPLEIFVVWHGGMSIHGGIFGAFIVLYYYSKKYKINILRLTDLFTLPAGIGLSFGRLANFVNQELVGKVTTSNLGIVFPLYDTKIRWPYQLFEGFKTLVIFELLLYLQFFRKLKSGVITGLFLILFSFGRFILDFFRQPDILFFNIISMGQVLCLIYGLIGIYILHISLRKK